MHNIPSPDTSDNGIERMIQAKGKTAARVTPADIEANIYSEFYFTAADGVRGESDMGTSPAGRASPLDLLTFCVLVLKNGFTVTGESACASPENFDAEIGRKIARQNAVQKIWPLMGYELRSKLANEEPARKQYGHSDVKSLKTEVSPQDLNTSFRIEMNDGAKFSGSVPWSITDPAAALEYMLDFCNQQVAQ